MSNALVQAAAAGDDAALAALVRAYHERVVRFGRRVCRDGVDADDAVQEAFTRLTRRPDVVAHPGALSWLMTVVKNTCRRLLRPFARERVPLSESTPDVSESASEALERQQLVSAVHAAIASLPRPLREVIVLRDVEGLSGDETAAALGLSVAAMKTRLHRAREQVRAALTT